MAQAIQIPKPFHEGFQKTDDPDETAALVALGVEMLPGCESKKIFTARNPYESGRPQLEFSVAARSSTWKTPTGILRAAYNSDGHHCYELDDLVEQIEAADTHQKRIELRDKIRAKLPLSHACYGRAFAEARRKVMRTLNDAIDYIKGRNRRGQPYMLDRKAKLRTQEKMKIR